jgi:hypothetical protein
LQNWPTIRHVRSARVAGFFWCMIPKLQNEHKMYQIVIKYPKCPWNIPSGHKIYQHFTSRGPQIFIQIEIFGLKRNHLATLLSAHCYTSHWDVKRVTSDYIKVWKKLTRFFPRVFIPIFLNLLRLEVNRDRCYDF